MRYVVGYSGLPGYPADMDIIGFHAESAPAAGLADRYKADTGTILSVSVVEDREPLEGARFLVVLGDSRSLRTGDRFEVQYTA